MAYRRFGIRQRRRRSSFRRRRFPVRRRFKRKFRRTSYSRRRIKQIASRKKFDTQLCSTNAATVPVTRLTLFNSTTYVLTCPTYLPTTVGKVTNDTRYRRSQQEIFFRGVKERINLTSSSGLIWRRVCFYSYEQLGVGRPQVAAHPGTGDNVLRRNIEPFLPETTHATTADLLWQGEKGIDFTEDTRIYSRLDAQRVKVVYDKSVRLNTNIPNETDTDVLGKTGEYKRWHGVNKNYRYNQEESGSNRDDNGLLNGWSTTSPMSPGNFYILDMFHNGGQYNTEPNVTIGTFSVQGTVYWHES
jgi:hypothetical protein